MTADLRDQLRRTLAGSYAVDAELGGGGMSRVFTATDLRLHRKVVIKVLSPELAASVNAERFEREIQLAASLQQANIVPLLSAGDTDGLPYFTMPYVEGESLRSRLAQGPLAIPEALGILRDVARALSYAHERGVVHRDIKPDNILLSHGAAVVTDFGIAKAISASRAERGSELTQTGTSIGTPAYMAPEQAAGDVDVDHRADLYSFGCTAFELLSGQVPFPGRSPAKTLAAHLSEPPPDLLALRPDTPPALAELVMRCLAKAPEARPQSAALVLRALDAASTASTVTTAPTASTSRALLLYAAVFVGIAGVTWLAASLLGLPRWVLPAAIILMALGLPAVLLAGGRRTLRWGVPVLGGFVFVVAAFMILRALGIGPAGSLLAAGKLHEREQLILTDFKVTNADTTLGRVASDAVRQGLLESNVLSLLPPAGIADLLERAQRSPNARLDLPLARELAQRQGIKAIIDGEVTGVAGGYFVTLRLVSTDSLAPIASVTATGSGPQGFIDAMDKVTRALRARAGESLRKVQRTAPLAEVTTGSLEALRKYSESFRANGVEQNAAKAVGLAREAVRLDSNFAMAWRQLGSAMINAGMPQAAADSALERAYQLRGRLSERERLFVEATYFSRGRHRSRQASIEAWEKLMQVGNAVDSGGALNYLAIAASSRRQYARAESLLVLAIRTDSTQAFPYTNLVGIQVNRGRLPEARASADLAVRHNPSSVTAQRITRDLLYYEGRIDELRRETDSILGSGDSRMDGWARNWKGVLALRDGHLAEAQQLGALPPGPESPGRKLERLNRAIGNAEVQLFVRRSSATALKRIDSLLGVTPLRSFPLADRPYLQLAGTLAELGRPEQARTLLAEYTRETTDTADRRLDEPAYHDDMGQILAAEGHYPEALAELRRADAGPDGPVNICQICLPLRLGRVFDAAGQADSAIAMYEQVLALPQWGIAATDVWLKPYLHERLAALYERLNNPTKAVEHYRALWQQWKNADPELQPRVDAAKAAIRRLSDLEKPH